MLDKQLWNSRIFIFRKKECSIPAKGNHNLWILGFQCKTIQLKLPLQNFPEIAFYCHFHLLHTLAIRLIPWFFIILSLLTLEIISLYFSQLPPQMQSRIRLLRPSYFLLDPALLSFAV